MTGAELLKIADESDVYCQRIAPQNARCRPHSRRASPLVGS